MIIQNNQQQGEVEDKDKQLLKMIRKHLEEEKYSEAEVAGNKVLILSMNNIDGKKDHT